MKKCNRPRCYTVEIKDCKEKALQRAIMLNEVTFLEDEKIRWLDIELPVHCNGKSRGPSIDLIGVDKSNNYVLCELKFGGQKADSVEYAERELLGYVDQINENKELIGNQQSHLNSRKDNLGNQIDLKRILLPNVRLVIAANKSYWSYWYPQSKNNHFYGDRRIEWYSIDVEEDEFIRQKNKREVYVPRLPPKSLVWRQLEKVS